MKRNRGPQAQPLGCPPSQHGHVFHDPTAFGSYRGFITQAAATISSVSSPRPLHRVGVGRDTPGF